MTAEQVRSSLLNPASFPPVQMWILSTILRKLTAQKSPTKSVSQGTQASEDI